MKKVEQKRTLMTALMLLQVYEKTAKQAAIKSYLKRGQNYEI